MNFVVPQQNTWKIDDDDDDDDDDGGGDDDDDDGSYFFPNLAHKYVFEHGWFELGILKYVIPKNKKSSLAKAVQQKDVNQNSAILKLRSLNPLERSAPCSQVFPAFVRH